jgi:hypothetical protein
MIGTAATRRAVGLASVTLALGVAAPAAARPFDLDKQGSYVPAQSALTQPPNLQAATSHDTGGGISDLGYVVIGSGIASLTLIGVGGTRAVSSRRRHRLAQPPLMPGG